MCVVDFVDVNVLVVCVVVDDVIACVLVFVSDVDDVVKGVVVVVCGDVKSDDWVESVVAGCVDVVVVVMKVVCDVGVAFVASCRNEGLGVFVVFVVSCVGVVVCCA